MRVTARSLVLDLLSTLRAGSMPVRALIEAGALFGIGENALRVALARLCAAGAVARDERGRYQLAAGREAIRRQVSGWRRLAERVRPWTGGWVGVHAAPSARGAVARRHAQALRFLGMRELRPSLWIRPDNLIGGVAATRVALADLGLTPGSLVCRLDSMSELDEAAAGALWDTAALVRRYRASQAELVASEARLPGLPEAEAMVESFELGGRVIREVVLDPLLPHPIGSPAERTALVQALRRYDAAGRAAWAAFMTRFDAPHRRAPVALGGEALGATAPARAGATP